MAPTEAQKRASAKYQRENIASLACRVKKEQAESFKAYCAGQGKTSNAVLRDYVLDCIGESDFPHSAQEHPQEGGGLQLSPEAEKAAQDGAEATGEAVPQFIERAVVTQAKRDANALRLGINPASGDKLDKEV